MRSTLNVITPASNHNLVTLETLKLELGITNSDSDDRLNQVIVRASGVVSGITGRVWVAEEVEEKFYFQFCEAAPQLILRRRPVIVVGSLVENGSTLTEDVDFSVDTEKGMLYRINYDNFINSIPGSPSVVVGYIAGYDLNGSPPGRVPSIVEQATIIMAKSYWFGSMRDPGIRSETTFELDSITYRDAADAEKAVRDLLSVVSEPSFA